ncbi:hypothetical protein EVAR_27376_1 [Eumeta japonica]|uniref:Uncharacterized protein n=1 Tax=Eumeta variegata TaxID=151549 RepID=A0A4C1X4X5_EUMVA|nr:hypothetical protein EVAR_27376_1 [Eumeta japonica]
MIACMKRFLDVSEARDICKDRTVSKSLVSAYPSRKQAFPPRVITPLRANTQIQIYNRTSEACSITILKICSHGIREMALASSTRVQRTPSCKTFGINAVVEIESDTIYRPKTKLGSGPNLDPESKSKASLEPESEVTPQLIVVEKGMIYNMSAPAYRG